MGHLWGMPCSLGNARFLLAPFLGPAMPSPLPGLSACLYPPAQVVTSGHSELARKKFVVSESQAAREDGIQGTQGSSLLQKLGPVICAMEVSNMSYREWHGLAGFLN